MFKKLFCFFCILLILGITSVSMAEVDIVAYYGMEEGSGDTVADPIGGNDGTTDGSPTWVDGPEGFGTALNFAGATSGVECGTFDPTVDGKVSFAFWAYFEGEGGDQYQGLICKNGATQMFMTEVFGDSGSIYWNSSGTDDWGLTTLTAGQWVHIAIVHDNANATTDVYRNGEYQRTSNATWNDGASSDGPVRIGSAWGGSGFYGAVDEVYFFSSLLTADEVVAVMNGEYGPNVSPSGLAKKPYPSNNEDNISIDVGTIWWKSGEFVEVNGGTHNVFFGTNFNDVNDSTVDAILGNTVASPAQAADANTFAPGKLEYGTTYYWRVDEANQPPDTTVYKG
ncbi:MAG: LamG domain-containing protein, partial [Sedimentisphaerales bacterium]|nr:LamG domain-containing protein [Sedimentisphaerales bacterium]